MKDLAIFKHSNDKLKFKPGRREFLKAGLLTSTGILAGCNLDSLFQSKSKPKPNLLFVFSDQQSRDMLGCYGNQQLITPNIDTCAQDSIRFNHCVSSQPVCTPYRGMLMTGRHPLYNGCFSNDIQLLKTNGNSFAEVLKKNGYRTGYFGKWHLYGGDRNRPIPQGEHRHGFDVFKTNNCDMNYLPGDCFYWDENGKKQFFDEWEPFGQTRQACNFIKENNKKPFAAFVSWHPPHHIDTETGINYTNGAIKEMLDLYDPEQIKLRPNVEDNPEIRKYYHGHMAMISGVDKAFAMLIEQLKKLNLYDNTIVVFTADHGDMLGSNGRLSPKSCPERGSVNVPLLIKLPESYRSGTTSDLLIGSMDMMPSILSLLGISPPKNIHGNNLGGDIVQGKEDTVESIPLMYFAPAWRGVYTKQYTYAVGGTWAPAGSPQEAFSANVLYDKTNDQYEMNNRFNDPDFKNIQEHLSNMSMKWLYRFGDEFWHEKYILKKLMNTEDIGFFKSGEDGIMTMAGTMPIDILKAKMQGSVI
ncbi:MAG: hypothetical protein A2Y10_17600 [Planctomycetes bacterium GWF2_41_51]|nr:MAG: hypothetical protein A2Y10_17600 [Planctomycetes bacterium GWF2_41_51]HBG28042.1 hypothetical protein [Phycisphaerales bacterium]